MNTEITFPFQLAPVSMTFVQELITAAAITGLTISAVSQLGDCKLTVSADRHLTAPEKTALSTAFAAALLQFADL